jgi:hypothetical protein
MKIRHCMSRGAMLRLAACAGTLVAAAATAATTGASAASAAPGQLIVRLPCTSSTFDVFSTTAGEICYEGTGTIVPNIPNVDRITTGVNTGIIRVAAIAPQPVIPFRPHQTIVFPIAERVRLTFLTIRNT